MGGILTSYTFLKNRDRGRKFSLISYWVHRYMRMAPALAMQLLFEATLTNRLGSGPKWKTFAKTTEDACRRDWWKHMLFINNWWGIEKCMPHTWYIAADMQYNMLAPLLLIPLHRRPRLGLALALGAGIVSCFVTFGLAIGYEEKVDLFKNATSDIGRRLYRASYNRLIPWLTGFAMGYFMYKYQYLCVVSSEHKIIIQIGHKLKKIMIWISSYVITLFVSPLLTLMVEHPFTLIEMVLHYRFSSDKWKPDPQAVASYGTIPPSQVSKSEGIVNGSFELAEDSRRRITENSTTGV
ncbi:hypothetical protein C0J52_00559 [Blattella germanica]|nr:hypothetical protein C0J52_00559 [Blattella germanica]